MKITVLCRYHLSELEEYRTKVDGYGDVEILVGPCDQCIQNERDESYEEGLKDGERMESGRG